MCRARPTQSTTSIHSSGQPMTTAVAATAANESTETLNLLSSFPSSVLCCPHLVSFPTFNVVTVSPLLWSMLFQVGRTPAVYCYISDNHVTVFTKVSIFSLNKKKKANLSLWMEILSATSHSEVWLGTGEDTSGLERPSGVYCILLRLSGLSLCDKHK